MLFWVGAHLQEKVESLLTQAEEAGALPADLSSKLYGMLSFLEEGVYDRIGTGGLNPLKDRQHESERELTPSIRASFEVVRAVLRLKPRRQAEVLPSQFLWFLPASDAAEDLPRQGAGGFLLLWQNRSPAH